MQYPTLEVLQEKKQQILERIYAYHLRLWQNSRGNVFFISSQYRGLWLEHTYDSIVWAGLMPGQQEVSANQIRLFIDHQKSNGQLPCFILEDRIGYSQIQECVSFASLCLDAIRQNPQDGTLLPDCYNACTKWDAWLCNARMSQHTGLIEMYCGYDTGHDNSGRLLGLKYDQEAVNNDGAAFPENDPVLPILAPDINAVFYGNRMALARMAEQLGKPQEAETWRIKAEEVKKALFRYCYNEEDQFFYDVDKYGNQRKVRSISITNVLCEGITDYELGNQILERYLFNEREFWTPYPFPSVSISDASWQQTLPGNSWGFYSQGLTALRSLRWLENYGRENELEILMRRWITAWCNSSGIQFGQELHPLTGEPSQSSQWYSSCMLFYLQAVKRLHGL